MNCRHCESPKTRKNGNNNGIQRYKCKNCGKTFNETPPKFSEKTKQDALLMYLNNTGIRKIALFLGTSPPTILNWLKQKHVILQKMLQDFQPNVSENADIIERVSFWGITDNVSWRSGGLPLPFDHDGLAKPAYYRIIEALEAFKQKK